MGTITTRDGTEIFYKDWGKGQPIVFSHGWPLSADDWDTQMLFFLKHGYRVIAHDRRGHGRSTQVSDGHDMDHYADDLAALTGGEVAHYLGRHGESRVAKAALISAMPPLMVKTAANPGGLPKEVFDGLQARLAANRSQFYCDLPEGPFYGFNRPGVKASEAIIQNWWRQGMMGGATAPTEPRRLTKKSYLAPSPPPCDAPEKPISSDSRSYDQPTSTSDAFCKITERRQTSAKS